MAEKNGPKTVNAKKYIYSEKEPENRASLNVMEKAKEKDTCYQIIKDHVSVGNLEFLVQDSLRGRLLFDYQEWGRELWGTFEQHINHLLADIRYVCYGCPPFPVAYELSRAIIAEAELTASMADATQCLQPLFADKKDLLKHYYAEFKSLSNHYETGTPRRHNKLKAQDDTLTDPEVRWPLLDEFSTYHRNNTRSEIQNMEKDKEQFFQEHPEKESFEDYPYIHEKEWNDVFSSIFYYNDKRAKNAAQTLAMDVEDALQSLLGSLALATADCDYLIGKNGHEFRRQMVALTGSLFYKKSDRTIKSKTNAHYERYLDKQLLEKGSLTDEQAGILRKIARESALEELYPEEYKDYIRHKYLLERDAIIELEDFREWMTGLFKTQYVGGVFNEGGELESIKLDDSLNSRVDGKTGWERFVNTLIVAAQLEEMSASSSADVRDTGTAVDDPVKACLQEVVEKARKEGRTAEKNWWFRLFAPMRELGLIGSEGKGKYKPFFTQMHEWFHEETKGFDDTNWSKSFSDEEKKWKKAGMITHGEWSTHRSKGPKGVWTDLQREKAVTAYELWGELNDLRKKQATGNGAYSM